MPKIHIDKATDDQLRHFARVTLGLDVHNFAGAKTLRAKIRESGHEGDMIDVPDAEAPKSPAQPKVSAAELDPALFLSDGERMAKGLQPLTAEERELRDSAYVTITINKNQDDDPDQTVKIGVNGTAMLIERGVPSKVRWPFYVVLKNAVRAVPVVNRDKQIERWESVHAYPFQLNEGPRLPTAA